MNVRELNPVQNQALPGDVVIDMAALNLQPEVNSAASDLLGETKQVEAPAATLWTAFSEAPKPLFEEFKSAFLHGAIAAFLVDLSESKLRAYGCSERQVKSVTFAIEMLFALYSGSLISTSTENVVFHAMKYYDYSDYHAKLSGKTAGVVVSVLQDFSPIGAAKVAASTAGSFAGSRLSLWTTEKVKQTANQWMEPKAKLNSGIHIV